MHKKLILALLCSLGITLLGACAGKETGPETTLAPTQTATGTAAETDATAPVQNNIPATTPAPIEGYTERESAAIRNVLENRLVYKTDKVSSVDLWMDSTYFETGTYLGTIRLPKNSNFQSLDVSSDIQVLKMDNRDWLAVTAKATILTNGEILPYEDDVLEIMIPIQKELDGSITLIDYYTKKYQRAENTEHYTNNNYIRTQLNVMLADVTLDGVDDYIETFVYLPPDADMTAELDTLVQHQIMVDEIRVQVYDGTTATKDDLGTPIWSSGYSSAHAGNGQVSIVHKDGLSYLLCTSLWEGQGSINYSFDVMALDSKGRQYIIDQFDVDMDERHYTADTTWDDRKQLIASFRDKLTPWFFDAQLVAATDVSLDTFAQLYTTEHHQYIPQNFYDIIWQRWGL